MSGPPPDVDPDPDRHPRPDPKGTTGRAPWQKVVAVLGLVVLLVLLVVLIAGGHTPRAHGSTGTAPAGFVRHLQG